MSNGPDLAQRIVTTCHELSLNTDVQAQFTVLNDLIATDSAFCESPDAFIELFTALERQNVLIPRLFTVSTPYGLWNCDFMGPLGVSKGFYLSAGYAEHETIRGLADMDHFPGILQNTLKTGGQVLLLWDPFAGVIAGQGTPPESAASES